MVYNKYWNLDDDDFRINNFSTEFILLVPTLLNTFSSENEINIKNSEKSLITSLILGSVAKKNNILIFKVTSIILISSVIGILKLEVKIVFINYFDNFEN